MPQEISLLTAAGPVLDGIRQCVHGLVVATDEGAAKVDALEGFLVVLIALVLGVEVGDLADVVADGEQELEAKTNKKK